MNEINDLSLSSGQSEVSSTIIYSQEILPEHSLSLSSSLSSSLSPTIEITPHKERERERDRERESLGERSERSERSGEKRRRTNYSIGGNKVKIEEAVKYLLELSERARPNVRNVAEKMGIPYNTLRDHFKKAQGLMAPPRRTVFDYPMAEYKGGEMPPEGSSAHTVEMELPVFSPYDVRRRGRKPALPRLIENQLKTFIKEMGAIGLMIDRTQLKQVAYKIANDLQLVEFKATDMWLQAFQSRHGISVAHSGGSKKKGWRLPDIPVYGSSTYSQWKLAQNKSLEDYSTANDTSYSTVVDESTSENVQNDGNPVLYSVSASMEVSASDIANPSDSAQSVTDISYVADEVKEDHIQEAQLQAQTAENDYANYNPHDYPPADQAHLMQLQANQYHQRMFPTTVSDEELRARSIASFRSILEEIQMVILSESGGSYLPTLLVNPDSIGQHSDATSSSMDAQHENSALDSNHHLSSHQWDLVSLILPSIETCSLLSSVGHDDSQQIPEGYYMHDPRLSDQGIQYQQDAGIDEPAMKRSKILPLAAFQQSQIDDTPQHHSGLSLGSMMTPTSKNRLDSPEDEHSTTASALAATQVLYNTSMNVGTPYANQYHQQHLYQSPHVSQSSRRQHSQLLPEEMSQPTTAVSDHETPAMIATKLHHPRGGNIYPSAATSLSRVPSSGLVSSVVTSSADQQPDDVHEENVYDIAMI